MIRLSEKAGFQTLLENCHWHCWCRFFRQSVPGLGFCRWKPAICNKRKKRKLPSLL